MTKYYGLWDKKRKIWLAFKFRSGWCQDFDLDAWKGKHKVKKMVNNKIPIWNSRRLTRIMLFYLPFIKEVGSNNLESKNYEIKRFMPADALLEKCRRNYYE